MIKHLKLLIIGLFAVSSMSFALAPSAAAFELFPCDSAGDSTVCKDGKSGDNPIYGADGIIGIAVNILSIIIGVAAIIVIIIAGIQYMLSTGDPTKVNNSKNAILYAVAGLIVAALAQVIVRLVLSRID